MPVEPSICGANIFLRKERERKKKKKKGREREEELSHERGRKGEGERERKRESESDRHSPFHSVISKAAFLSSFEFLIFIPVVGENNPEESVGGELRLVSMDLSLLVEQSSSV